MKSAKWVPLGTDREPVETVAQAKEAFRKRMAQKVVFAPRLVEESAAVVPAVG